jgi:hypothetical protein
MKSPEIERLVDEISAAATAVYSVLKAGYTETIYKGHKVGTHRLDLVLEQRRKVYVEFIRVMDEFRVEARRATNPGESAAALRGASTKYTWSFR